MATCGANFTLSLDTDGNVWFMGAKQGMGVHSMDDEDCQIQPIIFMAAEDYGPISFISSGITHSLAITENGSLYAFGENFS